jgi:outer membrane protein
VDTTVGVHLKGGADYFVSRQVALSAEARLVLAPDTDVTDRFGARTGSFDPTSFSGTVGIRYFFP